MSDRWRRPEGLAPSLRASLSALALVAACTGEDRGSGGGRWEFSADTVRSDSDGGSRSATWLRAVGKEGPRGAPQTEAVILRFDCLPGRAISTIMTDQALRQGSVEVQLKLDADPPRRLPGFAGTTPTGGQLVLTIPQDSVLALLSGHQRATIEHADGAGSSKRRRQRCCRHSRGLEQGLEEIYPDLFAAECGDAYAVNAKALEERIAATSAAE